MISIGAKIDALFALREKKRKHDEAIKELEKQMGALQQELITQTQVGEEKPPCRSRRS